MALMLHRSGRALGSFPDTSGISGNEIQCRDLAPFPAIHHSRKSTHQLELLQKPRCCEREQRRNIVLSCAAGELGAAGAQGGAERLEQPLPHVHVSLAQAAASDGHGQPIRSQERAVGTALGCYWGLFMLCAHSP